MKPKTFIIRLTLFGVLLAHLRPASAQWVQTNGPYGGNIFPLTVMGTEIIAASHDIVYKSTDYGVTWQKVGKAPGDIRSFFPDGEDLYLGASTYLGDQGTRSGVFVSRDKGKTWTGLNNGLRSDIGAIKIIKAGKILFVGGQVWGNEEYYAAVFRSTDDGAGWTEVYHGGQYSSINCFAARDSILFIGTFTTVFRSSDNGDHWVPANAGLEGSGVDALIFNGQNLFAGTWSGIFRTSDSGASWLVVDTTSSARGINCFAVRDSLMFAGTSGNGVLLSRDAGSTWGQANNGFPTYQTSIPPFVRSLVLLPAADISGQVYLFAGLSDFGVYRSTDYGGNWKESNNGLVETFVGAMYVDGANLLLGAAFSSSSYGRIFRSSDNGHTWTALDTVVPSPRSFVKVGDTLFAGTGIGVIVSSDAGLHWVAANNGLPTFGNRPAQVSSLVSIGSSLFAIAGETGPAVFRSTNLGASWTKASNGLEGQFLQALVKVGTDLFVGTISGGVFRSTDQGAGWTAVNNGLWSPTVYDFAVTPAGLFVGTYDGLFFSSDNGANWSARNAFPLLAQPVRTLHAAGRILFAITGIRRETPVYVSTDDGGSWKAINEGLEGTFIAWLESNSRYLFAGPSGLWRRPLSEMITSEFALEQNYPNPFNPTTTIRFSLPHSSFLTLKVFNLLGEEVVSLISEIFPAGNYSSQWNASGRASGVYFYRMVAGSFVETKKMILLR